MAEQNIRLTMDVTQEQMDTISQLFAHYDWDFNQIQQPNVDTLRDSGGNDDMFEDGTRDRPLPMSDSSTQTDSHDSVHSEQEEFTPYHIDQDPNEEVRRCCLCKPCITSERNRQLWWENEDTNPSRRNHDLRKDKYRRFWTMMFHRNVWNDPRYLDAKCVVLQNDPRCRNLVCHRRDIMPKCVLSLVRGWFPNLPGIPYLGHLLGVKQ